MKSAWTKMIQKIQKNNFQNQLCPRHFWKWNLAKDGTLSITRLHRSTRHKRGGIVIKFIFWFWKSNYSQFVISNNQLCRFNMKKFLRAKNMMSVQKIDFCKLQCVVFSKTKKHHKNQGTLNQLPLYFGPSVSPLRLVSSASLCGTRRTIARQNRMTLTGYD